MTDEIIQQILMLKYGIGAACVLFVLYILFKVAVFVYEVKNKETLKEKQDEEYRRVKLEESIREAIGSVEHLTDELQKLHKEVAMLPKILKDLQKLFFVQKETLGPDEWNNLMAKFKTEKELNS